MRYRKKFRDLGFVFNDLFILQNIYCSKQINKIDSAFLSVSEYKMKLKTSE